MSKDDIDKAVREAEQFAAEDKKRREEVDAKNAAENLCYTVEKLISETGDKMDAAEKSDLEAKVKVLKDAMNANNMDAIKSASDDLQKAMYAVSEKLYQSAAPQQGPQAGPADQASGSAGANGGNVFDADFKDGDDNNK